MLWALSCPRAWSGVELPETECENGESDSDMMVTVLAVYSKQMDLTSMGWEQPDDACSAELSEVITDADRGSVARGLVCSGT
jgi:hypothetical protein